MIARQLFLAAYDVSEPKRLQQALRVLKNYATGGQKSVFECYLSTREKQCLLNEVEEVLELTEDRFMLINLDPRQTVRALGIGQVPVDPTFFYVG
ncbi:CRISPR-associated endoribonuclease Cas2 1 [Gammaproteobacteria bacterium]